MLGLNVTYITYASFVESYLGLRAGDCDIAVTAAEVDPYRLLCTAACPAVPAGGFPLNDYDYANGWSPKLLSDLCCLDFSAPYMSSGCALTSLTKRKSSQLVDIFFKPQVVNTGAILLLIMMCIGWLMALLERYAPVVPAQLGADRERIDTPAMGVYWSMTTMCACLRARCT